jgi:hypothetical protein
LSRITIEADPIFPGQKVKDIKLYNTKISKYYTLVKRSTDKTGKKHLCAYTQGWKKPGFKKKKPAQ